MKQTVLSVVNISASGTIFADFMKQVIGEDGNVISQEPHRLTLEPGSDIDQIIENLNQVLWKENDAPVSAEAIQALKDSAAQIWTPEIIEAYQTTLAVV